MTSKEEMVIKYNLVIFFENNEPLDQMCPRVQYLKLKSLMIIIKKKGKEKEKCSDDDSNGGGDIIIYTLNNLEVK